MTALRRPVVSIEEDAAQWILRREESGWSERDEAELEAWLDQAMAHRAAFWRLEHGWRAADRVAALGETGTTGRWRRARPLRWLKVPEQLPRSAISAGIAASLAIAIGIAWWHEPATPWGKADAGDYRTPQGGRRSVILADGSHVDLNTATALRQSPNDGGRVVWLDHGEAFFDIVHDPAHPFVVHAGSRTVTVLGTRFSVRNDGPTMTVAVLSGRVRVRDAQTPAAPAGAMIVNAGDVAIVRTGGVKVATDTPARVDALTAWREGRVMFDDTPLTDAVAEFNRYGNPPIRIADPAVGTLKIGGSFRTDEADAFVALLHRAYGVRVSRTDGAVVLGR